MYVVAQFPWTSPVPGYLAQISKCVLFACVCVKLGLDATPMNVDDAPDGIRNQKSGLKQTDPHGLTRNLPASFIKQPAGPAACKNLRMAHVAAHGQAHAWAHHQAHVQTHAQAHADRHN